MAFIKKHIPERVRRTIAETLGISSERRSISELEKRIDFLYELIYLDLSGKKEEAMASLIQRSQTRWLESSPNSALTWGEELSGDNFVSKVDSYGGFGLNKAVLEVGSGYGRLLKSCLELKVAFKQYVGLDISAKNIAYLWNTFKQENISFVQGNAENISFDTTFDTVISSLTFKHLFPTFEKPLKNLAKYVNDDGMFFFDLIEGNRVYFEGDGLTFIHHYTRAEITEILSRCGLQLVAFDEVQHGPRHNRLLVSARSAR
jgi:SAM-dependent methyltransferase